MFRSLEVCVSIYSCTGSYGKYQILVTNGHVCARLLSGYVVSNPNPGLLGKHLQLSWEHFPWSFDRDMEAPGETLHLTTPDWIAE